MNEATGKQPADEGILRERVGGGVVLTIHAPASRNACSVEMRVALRAYLEEALADDSCRYVVLTGSDGNFCSGGRLPADIQPDPERTRANVAVLQDIVRLLHCGPKPTLAATEGVAFGAGLSLAMACDHVVAGNSARFCASFGRVGLMPDAGLAWTLRQRTGAAVARDMLLTAREVQAPQAKVIGLVEEVVPAGKALEVALVAAQRYLPIAPLSIAATKRVLASGAASLDAVLEAESREQPELTISQDYAEGRAAFREKRAPVFRGI